MLATAYSARIDLAGRCAIHTPYDENIRAALRAIPGRFWDREQRVWTINLGPDRAEAVARFLAAFEAIEPTEEMVGLLEELRGRRNLRRPGVEVVMPADEVCLSLCDDWDQSLVEELAAAPGAIRHPAIGRISVPIRPETRHRLIATLDRPGVRLHPRTLSRLEPPAAPPPPTRPSGRPGRWEGWVSTTMLEGRPHFVLTTVAGAAPSALVQHAHARRTGRVWTLPMDGRHRLLMEGLLARHPYMLVDRRTSRCLEELDVHAPEDPPPPAIITTTGDADEREFHLEVLWDTAALDDADQLPETERPRDPYREGGDVATDAVLTADPATATSVDELVRRQGLAVDAAAAQLLDELLEAQAEGDELVRLSAAHDDPEFRAPPGLTGELMPFQRAGVAYALRRRRTFIADEQGLGKTVQALAALEAANAYPAIVVCPASLKLNWLREAYRWLPVRTTRVVSGGRSPLPEADIVVVNYDVLHAHVDALAQSGAVALVFDEAHYCKNPTARRTKALVDLSERLPDDALRLALTGTPLVNRPKELVPQLRALRRLEDFGSGASFERRFRAGEARRRLHWHLRSSCYVRRRKQDVLKQLPAKRRITVPVPLTNDAEYRRLEDDLIAWLQAAVPDPAQLARRIDNALRAEALVKLNALRHVAARGKLKAANEWIASFLASGEKLVVFAHHRDVQDALLATFPDAARIVGADAVAERDANVERFQAGDGPSLCVCSLEAASHGFTLTAAASVAFLELGWTPAKHDQAEDRVHRIGQDRHVTAWYLLAADTIDERIAALIDHKRALVGSVTDGSAGAEVAVVDRLLADLAARDPAVLAA